jgi:hypothetical protein
MFELVGYALMRAVGLGWLWGEASFTQLTTEVEEENGSFRLVPVKHDVMGDGSWFLPIGFFFILFCMVGGYAAWIHFSGAR